MFKFKNILLLFLWLLAESVSAQTSKEFWFVAPEISSGHVDRPISLRVTTYQDAAQVTLALPANSTFTPITVSVAANSDYTFDLTPYINDIESLTPNQVDSNGIFVSSTQNITAYYEIAATLNTDIFSLKGDNALGTSFLISGQTAWQSGVFTPTPYSTAHIVASEDSTQITITPSVAINGHAAGVSFTISLNKGETYTLRANGTAPSDRFPGTEISSDKPIAITISDDSVENAYYGSCRDVIGDQTIPIENIGTEYILVKGFLGLSGSSEPDKVYIMAVQNGTSVTIDSSLSPIVLNKGDTHEATLSNSTMYVQSDKPVYVMHVTGFGCEVGMAIVPSVYCTGSDEVSFTRSQGGNFYIVVFVPTGSEGDFTINGTTNLLRASDFQVVDHTGGLWMAARKSYRQRQIAIGSSYRVINSSSKFHLGIINGSETQGCLYGYFTDFSSVHTGPIYHY